jgi:hypothetical protein
MGEGDQIRWYEAELVSFHNFPPDAVAAADAKTASTSNESPQIVDIVSYLVARKNYFRLLRTKHVFHSD